MKTHPRRAVRARTLLLGLVCVASLGACSDDPETRPADDVGNDTGADAGGDTDGSGLEPRCGDGVLSPAEACEGFDLRGESCLSLGFESGRLSCTEGCALDESLCVRCGDGVVGGSEVCDGSVDAALSCASVRGAGATGTLACADDCSAILDDDCADPPVDTPFSFCDIEADDCAEGLVCATTEVGDICVEACASSTECDAGQYCAPLGDGVSTCLDRPVEGQQCADAVPCADGLDCIAAFGAGEDVVSLCGRGCDACLAGELCVPVPSGAWDLENDVACAPGVVTACSPEFDCTDIDAGDAEVLRCARPLSICATPQQLYGFDGTGPSDDQICDLAGPTGGGRFCGLPDLVNPAEAVCYPIFGEGERLGTCIGLCDDGTATGLADYNCGDGWNCSAPPSAGLFYAQPGLPNDCSDDDRANCDADHSECVDFGSGPVCARAARVCTPDAEAR